MLASITLEWTEKDKQAELQSTNTNLKTQSQTEDNCTVSYTNKKEGIAQEKTLDLIKIKGKWLVMVNKDVKEQR